MSPRTKSILLLLATLIIGLLLGALINGYFVRQRLDRLGSLMTRDGYSSRLIEVVNPSNEEQREALRSVLDGASPKAIEIMRESRQAMRALNDSVKAELEDILTEEQMARLEEHLRFRRRGPWRDGRPRLEEPGPPRSPRFRRHMRRDSGRVHGDSMPPPPPPPIE
ncbi:MAG: hypothetical protein KJO98_14135 [Rhodothermia bacterium]|nr:hypothetical protein [Rhodothermia bacterium]